VILGTNADQSDAQMRLRNPWGAELGQLAPDVPDDLAQAAANMNKYGRIFTYPIKNFLKHFDLISYEK
jgi:hypothetical protein